MTQIPKFNSGDTMGEIRVESLNPLIDRTNAFLSDIATDEVTAEKFVGRNGVAAIDATTVVLQDAHGDFAYWDRNEGLMLEGQGTVAGKITVADKLDVKANEVNFTKKNGTHLFGSSDVLDLINLKAYRAIDDISNGLTAIIAAESTQLRAINRLCSTLYSYGDPATGKISVSNPSQKLGLLPPVASAGYGVLYFDYVKGNVNMVLLKWEDEEGKIYEGVMAENTWHFWGEQATIEDVEDYLLDLSLATGVLLTNELVVTR